MYAYGSRYGSFDLAVGRSAERNLNDRFASASYAPATPAVPLNPGSTTVLVISRRSVGPFAR
jgi:hypothetical protein